MILFNNNFQKNLIIKINVSIHYGIIIYTINAYMGVQELSGVCETGRTSLPGNEVGAMVHRVRCYNEVDTGTRD